MSRAPTHSLAGRVAVVTGGAGGLGQAICEALARGGASVIVGYHSSNQVARQVAEALPKPSPQTRHAALQASVTDSASLAALARQVHTDWGGCDILVNCAGTTRYVPHADLDALDDALIDQVLATNVRGPLAAVRAFKPLLERAGNGLVVNISSIAAVTAMGSNIAYCASKAALNNVTLSLARALAPAIRVVSVSPGLSDTEFVKQMDHGWRDEQATRTPLKRLALPHEVAAAVIAVATHLTFTTGAVIPVDGGRPLVSATLLAQHPLDARICAMRYHRLDLNLLVPLRALLVYKNVTRAAQSVHVSQSAMSGILARLREHFDDLLIVPIGRRMELTPLGQSMVEPVTQLLLHIDATLGTRPTFDAATATQHFSIVASDYVLSVLLADVLQRVHREAPGVSVELRLPASTSAAELEDGELDLLITPARFSAASQASRLLFTDGYCVVADPSYWRGSESVSLEHYVSLRHAIYESRGKPFFDDWFDREHGPLRRVEVQVHSFQQLPLVIAGTARVATMHARMAQRIAHAAGLKLVRLDFPVPQIEEMLQWHKLREAQPAGQWLRELILQQAATLPPAPF